MLMMWLLRKSMCDHETNQGFTHEHIELRIRLKNAAYHLVYIIQSARCSCTKQTCLGFTWPKTTACGLCDFACFQYYLCFFPTLYDTHTHEL